MLHVLILIFLVSMLNVDWSENWLDASARENPISPFSIFLIPVFFYLNLLWLMPRFFKKERWHQYLFLTVVLITIPELIRLVYVLVNNDLSLSFSNIDRAFWVRDNVIFGTINPVWLGMIPSAGYFLVKSYVINSKRLATLENQKLKLELSVIKSQINPHFFFNSLNTLDGLIDHDATKAKQYVQLLGKVYRYILSKGNEDVVEASEEWAFCQDFITLIHLRFGEAYQFSIDKTQNNLKDKWLPPAALQGLLENAVKHNVGTIKNPLVIEISIEELNVIVQNEIVPKKGNPESTGTGLANLAARYKLLFGREVEIEKYEIFKVTLPLVQKHQ